MKSTWHSSEDSSIDILRSVSGTHNNNLTWWISHQTCKTIKHLMPWIWIIYLRPKKPKTQPTLLLLLFIIKHRFLCYKILFSPTLQNSLHAKSFFENEELQRMNCRNYFNVRIYKSVYMHERIVALKKNQERESVFIKLVLLKFDCFRGSIFFIS